MFMMGQGGELLVWFYLCFLKKKILSVIFTYGYCHREVKCRLLQLIWNSVNSFLAEAKSNKDCKYYFLQITYTRNIDHVGY